MEISSEREKELDTYISNHTDAEVGEWPLEISGDVQRRPFHKFPISLLRFNVNNGRLAMEVSEWESSHERKLDANDPEDGRIIRDLLLSLDESDTNLLKEDLRQKKQIEPGVITNDGYVINGNRRMAILLLLHEQEPTGKWEYLDAIRLPKSVGEKDLWKIEAGLQLSKDKISEYHPVNELLKIKQGRDRGLEPKEIAAAMYGRTVDEVEQALERLQLIDSFLEFFNPKKPQNYGLIKQFGLHEHFIDIQKTIMAPAQRQGLPKKEIYKRLIGAFALLRAGILVQSIQKKKRGVTHWDVRDLGKIYSDGDAQDEYIKNLENSIKDPKQIASIKPEVILEGFKSAKEVLTNKEDRDKPVTLIERAVKALKSIDQSNPHIKDSHAVETFEKLKKVVNELERTIKSS